MTTEPTKAKQIAISPQQKIRELLSKQQDQIAKALPKFLTPDRFIRVALTTINKNPKLLECTQESLMACLMDCAQLGLEPDNVLGRAYLIPFNDRKNNRIICTLIIGYKGLCDLAYRSGKVKSLMAQIVCEKDKFDFQFGLAHKLDHVPYFGEEDRGKVIAVYAYAIMENGVTAFDVMGIDDVERIKKRSKSPDNGPWQTDWDEMARKTVLKRLSKYLPLSVEFMDAVARDNESEEEEKLKAAKIVLPVAQEVSALADKEEVIPMPTKTRQEPVEANSVGGTPDGFGPLEREAEVDEDPESTLVNLMRKSGLSFAQIKPIIMPNRLCGRDAKSVDDLIADNCRKIIADWDLIASAAKAEATP